jgi:hypothetical protein
MKLGWWAAVVRGSLFLIFFSERTPCPSAIAGNCIASQGAASPKRR